MHTMATSKKRGADATAEGRAKHAAQARRGINTSSAKNAELISPDKPLTDMQRAFVKFWAQGESILSASAKAGYNDGGAYAYRLVRMPNVLRMYEDEKRLYEEASQMTRKRVMDGLLESIELAKLMAEPGTMVSGWREIGKMCGYYEPVQKKLDITINGKVMLDRLDRMSDAELFKVIAETGQQVLEAEAALMEQEDGDGEPE